MYRLIFESGKRKGQAFEANNKPIVDIGRDPSCALCLEESGVSRRHSILQQREDGIYITDLGSTNGTYVNQVKISRETRLRSGDRIEIGAARMVFELAPPVPAGEARRAGKLFVVAMVCIGAILVVELMALGWAWLARARAKVERAGAATVTTTVAPAPVAEVAPPPPTVPPAVESTEQQLESKLKRAEELARQISAAGTASQAQVEALNTELRNIRTEIEDLKKRLEEALARQPAATPPPSPPSPPPRATADPILLRAQQMVAEAERARMTGQFDQAIRVLQSAVVLAPSYVPAYVALAEVYQMRGMNDAARSMWQKLVAMGPGIGEPYAEANRQLEEMARREAARRLPELKPLVTPVLTNVPTRVELPRQLRIVEAVKIDHPEDRSVDERYEVRFLIRAQTGEKFVASSEVKIEVRFYDRLDTGEVVETNAETTEEFAVPSVWESFERKTFLAQYRAPKGLRKKETEETGKKRRSYGYIIRVWYRGKLQDERSEPERLASLLAAQAGKAP